MSPRERFCTLLLKLFGREAVDGAVYEEQHKVYISQSVYTVSPSIGQVESQTLRAQFQVVEEAQHKH